MNHHTLHRGWAPILTAEDRQTAEVSLLRIADALGDSSDVAGSLADGSPSLALFFAYMSEAYQDGRWRELACRFLTKALDTPFDGELRTSFMAGVTGVMWTARHLGSDFVPNDIDDKTAALDVELLSLLDQRPWRGVYDHSHGVAGYGLYALEAAHHASSRLILEKCVDCLHDTALPTKHGVTWWTFPHNLTDEWRKRFPAGCFNLGLAHGIPSIIAFLGQVCREDVTPDKTRALLRRAICWLLSKRNPKGSLTNFADALGVDQPIVSGGSRVAWCYGDLGVSTALYWASSSAGLNEYVDEAIDIARDAAHRTDDEDVGVKDACICHGAAGNAHVFNRFFQATGERIFADAARYWFRRTLDYARPGEGMGGYRSWRGTDAGFDDPWVALPGLFGGSAGIGLALLGAVRDVQPDWDRTLLVSMPPRASTQLEDHEAAGRGGHNIDVPESL